MKKKKSTIVQLVTFERPDIKLHSIIKIVFLDRIAAYQHQNKSIDEAIAQKPMSADNASVSTRWICYENKFGCSR